MKRNTADPHYPFLPHVTRSCRSGRELWIASNHGVSSSYCSIGHPQDCEIQNSIHLDRGRWPVAVEIEVKFLFQANDMVNPMSLMKFTLLPRSSTGAQSSVQHIDFTESPLSSIDNSLGLSAALGRVTAAET